MSEVSQGAGWWIASDGRWYPPELHPDAAVRQAASVGAAAPSADAEPVAGGVSSSEQPAAGWPEPAVDPWVALARANAEAAAAGQAGGGTVTWGAAGSGGAAGPSRGRLRRAALGPGESRVPSRRRRTGRRPRAPFLVGGGAVLAAGAGIGLFLALGGSSSSNTSPQAVAAAVAGDFRASDLPQVCSLVVPSAQSVCRAGMEFASGFKVTTQGLAVGTVTQEGNDAVAVMVGTVCVSGVTSHPTCQTNTDPNIALDHGQTFLQAFAQASGAGPSAGGFTLAMVDQGGKWYLAFSS